MPLTNSQYETILRSYQQTQLKNQRLLQDRIEEVYSSIPEYQMLDQQVSSISVSKARNLLDGDQQALSELKSELQRITSRKKELLLKKGLSETYLSPIYTCSHCKDTGYVDGQKCHCFKKAIISYLYRQSNIEHVLNRENFSTLRTDFYEGESLELFLRSVTISKNFIENFMQDYQNIIFYGTVGTGKSFLSNCIAKEVIEQGHSVIYFSATNFFETLAKYTFDYKSKDELASIYEDIYTCDLLIIDDLGTEMTNKFASSQLFSCLNERHLGRKSTIISTNLSLEDLCDTYSERIFSRIMNYFLLCKIVGPDIRRLKNLTEKK